MQNSPIIRNATLQDAVRMAEVEAQSWPTELAAGCAAIQERIRVYQPGQWVAELQGRLVGVATSQRLAKDFFDAASPTYDRLTDRGRLTASHDPEGEIYHLIGVAVASAGRGHRLGRMLVDQELTFARSLPGITKIAGFTRPAGYHKHPDLPIDEYVNLRNDQDRLVDSTLAFHLEAGAHMVSIHSNWRPADSQARGYGVLIEYPIL